MNGADAALIASAGLLGLAGAPHCTAMCGAPCAAAIGNGGVRATVGFHAGRLAGYAAIGGIAAASVGALAGLAAWSPALRPLWTLVHVLALALGLWLLWQGRQPDWLSSLGRVPQAAAPRGWQQLRGPGRATLFGSLWFAWPCGLLHSALLVAALTGGAAAGATAMAGFALASSPGLLVGPWALRRLTRGGDAARAERWAVRAAGLMLVAAAGFALTHGLWADFVAWCLTP